MQVDQRVHIQSIQAWFAKHADHIGYTQLRPMATAFLYEQELVSKVAKAASGVKVISPDCSEMVTLICKWSGARSPSGPSYPYSSGYGSSQTMFDYLPHYSDPAYAKAGAIIEYKKNGVSVHVNMVYASDQPGNPLLFNHGSSVGPHLIRFNDFLAAEPSYVPTMLSTTDL